ncbi:ASCH domain-containing protein [Tessaracoccus coleopterorum]|uniref:hypothetical protein n=1 Tax=Tessaracoccus coleopterorum TaxID=2714950 RepID=UPI001E2FFF9A|nr:hypothetical protein [Tessaracoccus coleopterorum]
MTSSATTPTGPMQQSVPLRVLSVRQPWAWQILHEDKDVENRLLPTAYRGMVAIFAPYSPDVSALRQLPRVAPAWVDAPRHFELGAIIGWHASSTVTTPRGAERTSSAARSRCARPGHAAPTSTSCSPTRWRSPNPSRRGAGGVSGNPPSGSGTRCSGNTARNSGDGNAGRPGGH